MNFLVVGAAAKSFGILFLEFKDRFNSTNAATSWIVALSQCLALILGKFSSFPPFHNIPKETDTW